MNSKTYEQKIRDDARNSKKLDFFNGTSYTIQYIKLLIDRRNELSRILSHTNKEIKIYEQIISEE